MFELDMMYTSTEGVRYTGSKKDIIPKILDIVKKIDVSSVLDGFAGTTRVGQFFKKMGYNVDSNDIAIYSKIFGQCYLMNNKPKEYYQDMLDHLNNITPKHGWFSENYGGVNNNGSSIQSDGKKRPWQIHNTMKLDAIREEIDIITKDEVEKSVLLTSLIMAMDKVDNTLGHQVAYLSGWSPRSSNNMIMKAPFLITGDKEYNVYQEDIFNLSKNYDLTYLDPPYGTNNEVTKTTRVRYASYYHLWTTICKNDKPDLVGAALRRYDASSDTLPGAVSIFESTKYDDVLKSFEKIIENLNSRYILFSYNNKSKVKIEDLINIFSKYKNLNHFSFSHKENVMKSLTMNKEWMGDQGENLEYLFLIEK